MKILLAIDGSPCSDLAIAEVGRRPWPPETEIRVITVDRPVDPSLLSGGAPTLFDDLVKRQRAETMRHLDRATKTIQQQLPGLHVVPILRTGWPKQEILAEAETWGADLIVVGANGYGAIERFLLGSVSLAVATNAPCSVEIVRRPTEKPISESETNQG